MYYIFRWMNSGKINDILGGSGFHFLIEAIMGRMTWCSVIFASSLGHQDYSLAQLCYNKERKSVARSGVLGQRDEAW